MSNPIKTIARVTLTEILREKLVYGVLLLALLATAVSFFLSGISMEQNARILENSGLAFGTFAMMFTSIFVSTNSMSRDIERRALYFLLAKPVSRAQYVLGKYLGIVTFVLASYIALNAIFWIGASLSAANIAPKILANVAAGSMELAIITALGMLFASFAAPLNASLYTIALVIIGHSQSLMVEFVKESGSNALLKLVQAVYYVFPNLEKFNIRASLLYNLPLSISQMVWAATYAAFVIAIALYLTNLVTEKREL